MPTLAAVLRLIRPADWVKNVFVLPALVFGVRRSEGEAMLLSALAFAAFCLTSSGAYAINDVLDAARDRAHPVKRRRPVASGAVAPAAAVTIGLVLAGAGLAVGFAVNRALGWALIVYVILQAVYNLGLKRVIFVDVVIVALGFAVRSAAGALAIEVQISIWLLLCVFFLCLYLGFIKRLCDLSSAGGASAGAATAASWHSPAGYDSRGELNWLLGVSGVLAIVTYLMYAMSEHVFALFGPRSLGFAFLSPLVLVAVHRFYRGASSGHSDSPLAALREDPVVLITVALFAAGVVAMMYVPGLDGLLSGLVSGR